MLNLTQTWIKAAVEHRIIELRYYSEKTKKEFTIREVEPDFIGASRDGSTSGCWATFCHLRRAGPRCFKEETILGYHATDKTFEPSPYGRWRELLSAYRQLGLAEKPF